jgi:hypothetical protein
MKLSLLALIALAILLLNGCASSGFTSSAGGGDTVPGEKVSGGEDRVGAGVSGSTPTAQVKW